MTDTASHNRKHAGADVAKNERSFWRDEAKLSWFVAEERLSMMVGWLVYVAFLGGSAWVVYEFFSAAFSQEWESVALIAAAVVCPLRLAIYLYSKGGSAGNRLISEVETLKKKPTVNERLIALKDLKTKVNECANRWKKGIPLYSTKDRRPMESKEHNTKCAQHLCELASEANKITSQIDDPITLSVDFDRCVEAHGIRAEADSLMQRIDVAIQSLGRH